MFHSAEVPAILRGRHHHQLPAGAAAFTPADLPGLVYWYDFADVATITAVAGAVSAVADKSTNGRTITQSDPGARPVTGTTTRNGHNVLAFDGGDLLSSAPFVQAQPLTVFMVARSSTTDTANRQALGNGFGGPVPVVYQQSDVWRMYAGADMPSSTTDDTSWHLFTATFNGVTSSLRLDRSPIVSGDAGTTGYDTRPVSIGANVSITAPWLGEIAEVLAYASVLSSTDRATVETYLARWDV